MADELRMALAEVLRKAGVQEADFLFKAAKRAGADGHLWFEFSRQPGD